MKKRKQTQHRDRPESERVFGASPSSPVLSRPSTVQTEVQRFHLYSDLKKSDTDVRNSLPSSQLIERERKYIAFDLQRRLHPHSVRYKDFYHVLNSTGERRLMPQNIVIAKKR